MRTAFLLALILGAWLDLGASTARADGPGFEDLPRAGAPARGTTVKHAAISDAVTGVGTTLGFWAGYRTALAAGLTTFGTHLPGVLPLLGGSLAGGALSALVQKYQTGRVDWGSVAFSTAGSLVGASVLGIGGGVAGAIAGDLAWRETKALYQRVRARSVVRGRSAGDARQLRAAR